MAIDGVAFISTWPPRQREIVCPGCGAPSTSATDYSSFVLTCGKSRKKLLVIRIPDLKSGSQESVGAAEDLRGELREIIRHVRMREAVKLSRIRVPDVMRGSFHIREIERDNTAEQVTLAMAAFD